MLKKILTSVLLVLCGLGVHADVNVAQVSQQDAGNWVPVMLLVVMSVATTVIWIVVSRRGKRRK